MLEYSKVDVLRRNHVGDWGTQDIGELELFYKASKHRFDGDDEFKERARKASFYNPYIPLALKELNDKGLIKDDEGAKVIKIIEGKKALPLVATEKDGRYSYASIDLAALWSRLPEEEVKWIIFVSLQAAKSAWWLPADESKYPNTSHVWFGLVLGDDGKRFRTRSTKVVKLVDLLDETKTRCKVAEWTAEELEHTAEVVGYGAVK
ncbi:putative arginine--tRNA ligase [Helianthus anomalus]